MIQHQCNFYGKSIFAAEQQKLEQPEVVRCRCENVETDTECGNLISKKHSNTSTGTLKRNCSVFISTYIFALFFFLYLFFTFMR